MNVRPVHEPPSTEPPTPEDRVLPRPRPARDVVLEPTPAPLTCEDNRYRESGDRHPRAQGSFSEQLEQALASSAFGVEAMVGHLGFRGALFDNLSGRELALLGPTVPIAGAPVHRAAYDSELPHVSPERAFRYFVEHPSEVFAAADITLSPGARTLRTGDRLFLDEPDLPVRAPIEVLVDSERREVVLQTLTGHPLRGENRFRFESDGAGGTRVVQRSSFQLSSAVTALGGEVSARLGFDPIDRQHAIWKAVHGQLADGAGVTHE